MLTKFLTALNKKDALLFNEKPLTISLKLIIIVLLMYMNDNNYLAIFMPVFLVPPLLFKNILQNKYYWVLLALISAIFYLILDLVAYVPNHKHIFAYAIIAVAIVLFFSKEENRTYMLSYQAKIIIGLCFLFATIGKFLAPEFLDGSFFEFTNTTDPRFFGVTSILNNIDILSLQANENNLGLLVNTINPKDSFNLLSNASISSSSFFLSYWTIFIEGMIAITFCLTNKYKLAQFRNWFLIIFIFTTYPIATVKGFAIILSALGFIQSIEDNKITKFSKFYLLVFVLLPLTDVPFSRLFNLFI